MTSPAQPAPDFVSSHINAPWRVRIWAGLALAMLALAVVIYLILPVAALQFVARQPWLGGAIEPTLRYNSVNATGPDAWPAFKAGIQSGDQIIALNGRPVTRRPDVDLALSTLTVGQSARLTVLRNDTVRDVVVPLTTFPLNDLFSLFVIPYLIGWAYLGIGAWVFWVRRTEVSGRVFTLFCATTAVGIGGIFDIYSTHLFYGVWTVAVGGAAAALMVLSLVFPQNVKWVERYPVLRLAPLAPMLALVGYSLYTLYAPVAADAYVYAWRYQYFFIGVAVLLMLGMMAYRWAASASLMVREQSRIILLGAGLAFAPMGLWIAQLALGIPTFFNAALNLPSFILFPAAVAYAFLRYRLLDSDIVLARGLVFAALSALVITGYGLLIFGFSLALGATLRADNPVILGLMVFLLVVIFNPLRNWLQRRIDDIFFRGQRAYNQRLEQFGRALTKANELSDVVRELYNQIDGALRPAHVYLFLRDSVENDYAAVGRGGPQNHTDVRFAADGPLASYLLRSRQSLLLVADAPPPADLLRDRARMALMGTALYVPLLGKNGLTGWLAVGPKLSGAAFAKDDVRFVESLADQSALAVERAAVVADLERRVKELNVVSQMSQAVSFTLAFDDLLELIYAQASKILPTQHAYIVLKSAIPQSAYYALYVENDERDSSKENKPFSISRGLEGEIFRLGQPIRVDDYVGECRRRNIVPGDKLFRAWLGVPLNAGAETIGVIVVGTLDPAITFSEDQTKVLWTIADQAASAIVKARLYEQTVNRARQLATLNEVSTGLASTLELDLLLKRIVESSVDILGCEAGSLFLTDTETGEYVFKVAVGPVGQDLVGMRIAPGRGFVGEAIESGKALTVNDVQSDPRWFKGADQSSGFITRMLMVVPLRFKGKAIGAVEVINKRDRTPFDQNDQTLLTAFAGPAAVAIENARLYQQTDQALAARVDELSVMQRIDRELNTALDMHRVMSVTLEWAVRRAQAQAGLVALVSNLDADLTAQVIAHAGAANPAEWDNQRLPLTDSAWAEAVASGEIRLLRPAPPALPRLQTDNHTVLVIPIKRENHVLAFIHLESANEHAFDEEQVSFVTRLVDHASIAITNAQLYAEVRAANAAKSDLMSFVAHELKTPMTPIKGYADMLLSGAVGPVNDMQKQFIGVIRRNIERMSVIVTDLNDSAKIEAGKMTFDPKVFDIGAVADDAVRTIRVAAEAKKQTVSLEVAPDCPPVYADDKRVAQVLNNLLSNAHKYTPEGGQLLVRISLQSAASIPNFDPRGAQYMVVVAVKDNGLGISPEDQKKLFQKFYRANDATAREMAPGTGLGLHIVKNLVELQGGHIWFESQFRHGSTFFVALPVASVAQPAPAPQNA